MTTLEQRRKYQREYAARKKREDPSFVQRQKEAARKYHSSESGKEKQRRWKLANAEKYKAGQDACRWSKPIVYMLAGARARAKRKGLDFDLRVEDIQIPETCPVLGLKLAFNRGFPKPNSPTIDRVDNNRGYVKDNVRVISHRANAIKSNATLGELLSVYEYVLNEVETKLEGR